MTLTEARKAVQLFAFLGMNMFAATLKTHTDCSHTPVPNQPAIGVWCQRFPKSSFTYWKSTGLCSCDHRRGYQGFPRAAYLLRCVNGLWSESDLRLIPPLLRCRKVDSSPALECPDPKSLPPPPTGAFWDRYWGLPFRSWRNNTASAVCDHNKGYMDSPGHYFSSPISCKNGKWSKFKPTPNFVGPMCILHDKCKANSPGRFHGLHVVRKFFDGERHEVWYACTENNTRLDKANAGRPCRVCQRITGKWVWINSKPPICQRSFCHLSQSVLQRFNSHIELLNKTHFANIGQFFHVRCKPGYIVTPSHRAAIPCGKDNSGLPFVGTLPSCRLVKRVCTAKCSAQPFLENSLRRSLQKMFQTSVQWLQQFTLCRIEQELTGLAMKPTCANWSWDGKEEDAMNFTMLQPHSKGSSLILHPRYTKCGQPLRKYTTTYTTVTLPTYGQLRVVLQYGSDGQTVRSTKFFLCPPNFKAFVPFPPKRWTCNIPSSCDRGDRVMRPKPPEHYEHLPEGMDIAIKHSSVAEAFAIHLLYNSHCPC